MTYAKQTTKYRVYQQKDPLDWMVRHCSPNLIVCDSRLDSLYGGQPYTHNERSQRTVMDWCSLREQSDNR